MMMQGANTELLQQAFTAFVSEYSLLLSVVSGFGILTGILAFIVLFMRFGANGDNPQERAKAAKELIVVGISTGALGSVTFLTWMLYHVVLG